MFLYIARRRLENEVKEILDEIGQDQDMKKDLIKGRQVDLAEELSKSTTTTATLPQLPPLSELPLSPQLPLSRNCHLYRDCHLYHNCHLYHKCHL